jgi:hypothetical protein
VDGVGNSASVQFGTFKIKYRGLLMRRRSVLAVYIHGRRVVVGQQIQFDTPSTFAVSNRSEDC